VPCGSSDRDRKGITSLSFVSRKTLPEPSLLFTGRSRRFALVHVCTSDPHLAHREISPPEGDTVATVRCPFCRENDDKVVDSRAGEDGAAIRRRRECLACGRRFTTYERIDELGVMVRKRDGTQEPFDREKLRNGIEHAATGRFDEHAIEALAAEIEEQLRTEGGEIGSDRIGVTVLERLRGLDHVAYLRFASVYKGFEDLADFEREVVELQKTTEPKRRPPN
jgi:transcriptional repressor NrdR